MRRAVPTVLCCLLLAACASGRPEASVLLAPEDRQAAPAVSGETLDGDELALGDLDGPAVVNFWASWCGPCVAEAPELRKVHDAYTGQGVSMVGINVQDRLPNARRFQADLRIPFPSWSDPASEIAARFGGIGPAALPSTLVLDAEHRVAARFFGAVTFSQLQGVLDPLIEERDAAAERS